jgi:hypothetical protein
MRRLLEAGHSGSGCGIYPLPTQNAWASVPDAERTFKCWTALLSCLVRSGEFWVFII